MKIVLVLSSLIALSICRPMVYEADFWSTILCKIIHGPCGPTLDDPKYGEDIEESKSLKTEDDEFTKIFEELLTAIADDSDGDSDDSDSDDSDESFEKFWKNLMGSKEDEDSDESDSDDSDDSDADLSDESFERFWDNFFNSDFMKDLIDSKEDSDENENKTDEKDDKSDEGTKDSDENTKKEDADVTNNEINDLDKMKNDVDASDAIIDEKKNEIDDSKAKKRDIDDLEMGTGSNVKNMLKNKSLTKEDLEGIELIMKLFKKGEESENGNHDPDYEDYFNNLLNEFDKNKKTLK